MLNFLRRNSLIIAVIGLTYCTPFASFGQIAIKDEARAAKLTPDLLELQRKDTQPNATKSKGLRQSAAPDNDDLPLTKVDRTQVRNGLIAIEAVSNDADGKALLENLTAMGLQDGRYYQRIVFGYFPISKLDQLKNVTPLHVARPAYKPFKNAGKVTSQGDTVMRANYARKNYGVTGAGSKVGVISDSYNSLNGAAAGVASDDLPADVQVLKDIPDGTDEGRAMAEIVHDVAPGAKIAFHTAYESQVDFALGILALANAGCNIIVDDIIYFAEPFFQDGIIAQAVDFVVKKQNVTYFSSAGNTDRLSYQKYFLNSGRPSPSIPTFKVEGNAHDFTGTGVITQKVTIPARGGEFFPILQWSDPFYSQSVQSGGVSGARTDLDIFVYYRGVLQPQLSSFGSNIGDDPIEAVDIVNNGTTPLEIEIAIVKYDGPDPSLIKWVDFGNATAQFVTQSSTTYGHSNAQSAISVGAAAWFQTPGYSSRLYPLPLIESFSSAGGTPILFTTYGQPIPAEIRLKPEIVAPDGGNNTFFGQQLNDGDTFPNFFGTSAAAPHAAAVAALLQERARNTMSPTDILKRLETTAIDMDDPTTPGFDTGFDFRTGFGFIQADKALMIDGKPLVLLQPIYDCQTGRITFVTSGGDGSPITFTAPGVTRTSPTSTTGIVEAGLRNDPKSIIITAMQGGVKVVFDFNFAAYCSGQNRAREAASGEPGTGLQVSVIGNPIAADFAEVEVKGAQGQPLKLRVNNTLGELTSTHAVEMAESVERHKVSIGRSPGLYFLQVSTPTESKTIKLIRQ
ncbi:S8 family serine peptidase [Spirosoma koreense]